MALARGCLTLLPEVYDRSFIIGGCIRVGVVLAMLLTSFHWKPFDKKIEPMGNRFQIMLFAFALMTAANTVAFLARQRAIQVEEYRDSYSSFEAYAAYMDLVLLSIAFCALMHIMYSKYKQKRA